ncbi:MAG: hypothetical protein ACLSWS_23915, partial [Faecalispora jeddahensis]
CDAQSFFVYHRPSSSLTHASAGQRSTAMLAKEIFHPQPREKHVPNFFNFRVCKISFSIDFVSGSFL